MSDATVRAKPKLAEVVAEQGRLKYWLAQSILISDGHFSNVLSGKRGLRIHQAEILASVLAVPVDEIFHMTLDSQEMS